MVVTPKREKMAVLLRAGHKSNDIIALAGVSRSLVGTVKKLLKIGLHLTRGPGNLEHALSGPLESFLASKKPLKRHQPSQ